MTLIIRKQGLSGNEFQYNMNFGLLLSAKKFGNVCDRIEQLIGYSGPLFSHLKFQWTNLTSKIYDFEKLFDK